MTRIIVLSDLLLVIGAMILITVGYVKADEEMLAAGLICIVIAAIVLVGLMCTRSFWCEVFGVKKED